MKSSTEETDPTNHAVRCVNRFLCLPEEDPFTLHLVQIQLVYDLGNHGPGLATANCTHEDRNETILASG